MGRYLEADRRKKSTYPDCVSAAGFVRVIFLFSLSMCSSGAQYLAPLKNDEGAYLRIK